MTRGLENKVALVTGGSSGIGRASALAFAREGAKVVIADVNVKGGEETVQMISKADGESIFVKTDVSKATEVQALIDTAIKTYGRLDYAHNNAGIESSWRSTVDCVEEDWDRIIAVNLKGVWLCMKYEIPHMLQRGKGAIVNTASVLGLIALEKRADYAASKHGVVGLTKVAALEYANTGIRINAVCPGVIRTQISEHMIARMFASSSEAEAGIRAIEPIGRMGTPEEVAKVVVWLCSDAASFVTGIAMPVDGGWVAK